MGAWRWLAVWVGFCLCASLLLATERAAAYPGNIVFTNAENPSGSLGYVTSAVWGGAAPTPAAGGCPVCHGNGAAVPPAPSNARLNGSLLAFAPGFSVAAG